MDDENKSQENKDYDFSETSEKNAVFYLLIESQIIDVVQEYTYLATQISSSGSLYQCHVNISRRKLLMTSSAWDDTWITFSKLKVALACKIFDSVISPIPTYNSEIGGVCAKPDFKTWDGSQIEKAHLQFCKRYFENKRASNIACRTELGRFPLNITINQKFSNTFCIYSLKMRNLSSKKFF